MKKSTFVTFLTAAILFSVQTGSLFAGSNGFVPQKLLFISNEVQGESLKRPSGVFYDCTRDEIYVADTGNGRIVIFDKNGIGRTSIKHYVDDKNGTRKPGEPRRLVVNSRGDIYLIDSLCNYVDILDYRGSHIGKIDLNDISDPSLAGMDEENLRPSAIAIDTKENIYVATSWKIFVFNPNQKLIKIIGTRGDDKGQFKAITGLWIDNTGKIYVTDAQGICVQVLLPDGTPVLGFGTHEVGNENFSLPMSIMTDSTGNIWVVDTLRHIASVFNPRGKFLDSIGNLGNGPGSLTFPVDISGNRKDLLIIVERGNPRIQCFQFQPVSKSP